MEDKELRLLAIIFNQNQTILKLLSTSFSGDMYDMIANTINDYENIYNEVFDREEITYTS